MKARYLKFEDVVNGKIVIMAKHEAFSKARYYEDFFSEYNEDREINTLEQAIDVLEDFEYYYKGEVKND